MKLANGIEVEIDAKIQHIEENWLEWSCDYLLPGEAEWRHGFIQGDGHFWDEDSLTDEGGDKVTPCASQTL